MPATLRASTTLMDGTTFQKEFPIWASTPPKFSSNFVKSEINKEVSGTNNVYYNTLKPILIVLTLTGVLPVVKLKIGKYIK